VSLPVKTGLPENLIVGDGFTIRFTAVDPTTGALVAGVKVSAVNVGCEIVDAGVGGGLQLGPFMLVPGPGA
jgi:hypothetical protein